jgi:hypothetical protein
VRERYKLDVGFTESYWHVQPLSSHDLTFGCHVIDLVVVLLFLPFVLEI